MATPGQVQAGGRSRVIVSASKSRFAQGHADIVDPATGERRALRATAAGFEGAFRASEGVSALSVALRDQSGEWLEVSHPYVARRLDDAVVALVPGTAGTRLQAIAIGPDGTVWIGVTAVPISTECHQARHKPSGCVRCSAIRRVALRTWWWMRGAVCMPWCSRPSAAV
jgi:hypothetical protein